MAEWSSAAQQVNQRHEKKKKVIGLIQLQISMANGMDKRVMSW